MTPYDTTKRVEIYRSRKLILLSYVIVGTLLAAVGSIIGLIRLFFIGGYINASFLFPEHPFFQIFGFLVLFITGVAVVLIPTFRGHTPKTGNMDYIFLGIMVIFQVLAYIGLYTSSDPRVFLSSASVLLLLYSIRYLYLIAVHVREGQRKADIADSFVLLSCVSLMLTSILMMIDTISSRFAFNLGLLYIVLVGYVGSIIFGVSLRVTPSLSSIGHKLMIKITFYSILIGVVLAFALDTSNLGGYYYVPGVLFLIAGLSIISAYSFYFVRSQRGQRSQPKRRFLEMGIVAYSKLAIGISLLWLVVGLVLGLISGTDPNSFYIRISFIHALSIGFVGSTIMGYAPLLLPGIISEKSPRTVIRPYSFFSMNIGTLFMIAGFLSGPSGVFASPLLVAGGVLILLGIIWYLIDIHLHIFILEDRSPVQFSDDW